MIGGGDSFQGLEAVLNVGSLIAYRSGLELVHGSVRAESGAVFKFSERWEVEVHGLEMGWAALVGGRGKRVTFATYLNDGAVDAWHVRLAPGQNTS